jgi:hypothetical protein
MPVADDPESPWQENRTVLISLGISKLVRFHKIRLQESLLSLLWYFRTISDDWPLGLARSTCVAPP